jgi:hypothetical protein
MQGDSLSLCRQCTTELPGDELMGPTPQNDPFEIEEVMESVDKNNGAPVIFSPSAERIAAKPKTKHGRKPKQPLWGEYKRLPDGADWTGVRCGHAGKKGTDFYGSNGLDCKKCLQAKRPVRSHPLSWTPETPTMAQAGTLKPETMIDAPKPEGLLEVPKTALTIIVPASITLKLPPLSEILLQVPSGNIKEWIIRGLREAEASRGLEELK